MELKMMINSDLAKLVGEYSDEELKKAQTIINPNEMFRTLTIRFEPTVE